MAENNSQLPNLPSPPIKAEPASEWANNTISALDSAEPTGGQPTSAVTTPGAQFPGAYPPTPGTAQPANGLSLNNMKETAKEYLHTAEQYVPSQDDMKKAAQNAGKIMSNYVPESVAGYLGPARSEDKSDLGDTTTPTTADDGKEDMTGIKSKDMVETDTNDSAGQTLMAAPARGSSNEPPSDNASTVTQPGSLLVGANDAGPATPYSYTAMVDPTQLPTQTAPTYGGDNHFHTDKTVDESVGTHGHPDGIVNHGEVDVYFGSGGKGAVKSHAPEPGSDEYVKPGISANKGAGPGGSRLPVLSMIGEDDSAGELQRLNGGTEKPVVVEKNNGPTEETTRQNEPTVGTTTNEPGSKNKVSDHDQGQQQNNKLMDNDTVNTEPRKYPLSQEDAGKNLNTGDQSTVDRNKEHEPTSGNGVANANTSTAATPGKLPSQTPVGSKFKEPPASPEGKGSPSEAEPSGVARPASPMSNPVNPHASRATSGPNDTKLKISTELPQDTSPKKKHGFLNKIKSLSKKLSP